LRDRILDGKKEMSVGNREDNTESVQVEEIKCDITLKCDITVHSVNFPETLNKYVMWLR
jgi:hypothetical protein